MLILGTLARMAPFSGHPTLHALLQKGEDEGTLEFLLRFNKTGDSATPTVPGTTIPQAGDGPITPPSTTQAPLGL